MPNPYTLAGLFAIPHTGKLRRRYPWRRPRNISIKRGLLKAEGYLRGLDVPPDSWMDLPRGLERTWKRHRQTQYHPQA